MKEGMGEGGMVTLCSPSVWFGSPSPPSPNVRSHRFSSHCSHHAGAFSLSLKDVSSQGAVVKHYKIHTSTEGGYYISPQAVFPTLQALVQHHSSMRDTGVKGSGMGQSLPHPNP